MSKVFGKSNKENLWEAIYLVRDYYLKYPLKMLDIADSSSHIDIERAILNLLNQNGLNTKPLLYKYNISLGETGLFANYKEFVNSRNTDLKDLFATTVYEIERAIMWGSRDYIVPF